MRAHVNRYRHHDPRITYRGTEPSRIDNLTDAVFGIAITLLIFNLANPNSFADLLTFTTTLPAFIISISFIILIWNEHLRFSEIYTLDDTWLFILNTVFNALVIFYVYPLRFLTLFLTEFFFGADLNVSIRGDQVPHLMIYYGSIVLALYFILFLLYDRAGRRKAVLELNAFEVFYTESHRRRLMIMVAVPLLSIALTAVISRGSFIWASVIGGAAYFLYTPAMILWYRRYERRAREFAAP